MSDEEQMNRFGEWWKDNGTSLLIAVGLAVTTIVGWNVYSSQQQQTMEAGTAVYAEYADATDEEQKSALAARIRAEFANSSFHALVALADAKTAVSQGDFAAAESALMEAQSAAPDDMLKDLASLRLAKVQYGLGNPDSALNALQSIRNPGYRPWALELIGDIYLAEGQTEQAFEAYSSAIEALGDEPARPLLEIKRDNAAPADGQFSVFAEPLDQALKEARETLDADTDADAAPSADTDQ
jgi:predicted negative regulator of RcsB-dependent stress response